MDLKEFLNENAPKEGEEVFQLENSKLLEIKVNGVVWAKAGSMISYTGNLEFERSSGGGLKKMLKKSVTSEGTTTMKVEGKGNLYVADQKKNIHILKLGEDDEISVNGNDVLAFEDSIEWDIKMIKSGGAASGGLFNMFLQGPGTIAITSHGDPLVLPTPVKADPQSIVAWTSNVSPDVKTDVNIKSLIGRSSGETFQLNFAEKGGFIIVQPFEEINPNAGQ